MEQERTKNLLEKGNNNLLGEIGCRLPDNQRLDFLKQYNSRLNKDIIYKIAEKIPPENLLEFFRLRFLQSENSIASLAIRLPKEKLLAFFKLGQLNDGYYDDNRMKVARNLPSSDLISFFQMKLLREEENVAELAMKLPEIHILEFLQMKLLKVERNIAKLVIRLPDEEFLQFWNLGLVSDLALLQPKIDKISDKLLNSFIDETKDYNLKHFLANAIRDEKLRSKKLDEVKRYAENEKILNSLEQIARGDGTPEQKERIERLLSRFARSGEKDKIPYN